MSTPRRQRRLEDISDDLHVVLRAVKGAKKLSEGAEQELDEIAWPLHREVAAILTLAVGRLVKIERKLSEESMRRGAGQ